MKVREHVWVADVCIICGAQSWAKLRAQAVLLGKGDPGVADERACLEREDYAGELRPEPKRREYAVEDADTISARLVELAKERLPADHGDPGDCG
jgi:hypothetical protein